MVLKIVVFLCALTGALLQEDHKGINRDPLDSIKLHIPTLSRSSFWTGIHEIDAKQAGAMTSLLKKGLRKYQTKNPQTSIIISKGDRVLIKKLAPGVKFDTHNELPSSNYLSVISVSIAILLENQKPSKIHGPMGSALEGKHLQDPIFGAHKKKTLYSLLSTLPVAYDAESIMNSNALRDLNANGKVVLSYVNAILGSTMHEAWMDALFALGIEVFSVTEAGQLKISLHHVLQCAHSIIHELKSIEIASSGVLPDAGQFFMFGWWINCPRELDVCLFPALPADLIISASPSLRIYISPSLELSVIVFNNKTTGVATLSDIAITDEAIWGEVRRSLDSVRGSTDRFSTPAAADSDSDGPSSEPIFLIYLIKLFYPVLFFIFWLLGVHGLVYCTLHFCWFIAVFLCKGTHAPRPKTAAKLN